MDVILMERIEKLGQMGDVVSVKAGYARNFLLPQGKALRATESNRTAFDAKRSQLEADNLKDREEASRMAEDMEGLSVIIVRQASDSDQLYGSVTTRNIADSITATGVTADRKQIKMSRPIKTVGMHRIRVDLHPEVSVEIIANVARSKEEAQIQARGERVSADGDTIGIDSDQVNVETVFEDGAGPDAEELLVRERAQDVGDKDPTEADNSTLDGTVV